MPNIKKQIAIGAGAHSRAPSPASISQKRHLGIEAAPVIMFLRNSRWPGASIITYCRFVWNRDLRGVVGDVLVALPGWRASMRLAPFERHAAPLGNGAQVFNLPPS